MAAFSLGGLSSPIWGGLADRFRLHRQLLVGGLFGAALGAALFPFALSLFLRIILALLSGIGLAAASTVANLFIVEVHPEPEWDARIGWLQTFYGGGQVIGLGARRIDRSERRPETGLWLAGGIGVAAIIPGRDRSAAGAAGFPAAPAGSPAPHASCRVACRVAPAPLPPAYNAGPQDAFRALPNVVRDLFLTAWVLSFSGGAAFFSFYPVLMQKVYGVLPGLSSHRLRPGRGAGSHPVCSGGNVVCKERTACRYFGTRWSFVLRLYLALTILAVVSFPGTRLARHAVLSFRRACLVFAQREQHGIGCFSVSEKRGRGDGHL